MKKRGKNIHNLIQQLFDIPKISGAEFNILHAQYLVAKGQDKNNLRIAMIQPYLRYLVKPCKRYANGDKYMFEDLIVAGYVKIDKALKDYDQKFNVPFWGFCRQNVIHAIQDEHHKIAFGKVSGYYTGLDLAEHKAGITKNRPQCLSMDHRLKDDEDDEGFVSRILPSYDITPLTELCEGEFVDELLATLREDRKAIVIDYAINRLSLKEIAVKMGITKKAVEGRLSYAFIEIKRYGIESGLLDKKFLTISSKYRCYWARSDKRKKQSHGYYEKRKENENRRQASDFDPLSDSANC